MGETIILRCDEKCKITIELNNSKTAEDILYALPLLDVKAEVWGKEVFFLTPLSIQLENGTTNVEKGDVAWWPPGNSIAIFYGKTPISTCNKPVPASEVTVIGNVMKGLKSLNRISSGDPLTLEKEEKEEEE